MSLLTNEEVRAGLAFTPDWKPVPEAIRAEYRFNDFVAAVAFVNRVAELAEAAGHHPDIDIRWNRVLLTLSTHDEGGVTDKDLALAAQIQTAAAP